MLTKKIKLYCCESPVLIENYKEACDDDTHVWKLHHRNEITEHGQVPRCVLISMGMWLNRPASELIFLPKAEHKELHANAKHFKTEHNLLQPLTLLTQMGKTIGDITDSDIDDMCEVVSRLRILFKQMHHNCYSPLSHNFRNYGGKGIRICDEWLNDKNQFVLWALKNGYKLTDKKRSQFILRKDSAGDFSPDNCYISNVLNDTCYAEEE